LKSGSLNLLEPSGPVQACNGIAVPLYCIDFEYNGQKELSFPSKTIQYKQLGTLSIAAYLSIWNSFNNALRY
jgi:hypothetical protein